MKNLKKAFALLLALIVALVMVPMASAASGGGFGDLPAGVYTYVSKTPVATAGSKAGEIQFLFGQEKNQLVWAFGADGSVTRGAETLSGGALEFFKGVYLSDRPVTDWTFGAVKNTDGYAGNVAGNVRITFSQDGRISEFLFTSGLPRMLAVLTKEITAPVLKITGNNANRIQSCITLVGSVNSLHLFDVGDIVMDNTTIGNDGNGVGIKSEKIGGDTFVVGTVTVDGAVNWNSKMGVIMPLGSQPGTLLTNGYDITFTGGSNIGRVGRDFTISTGAKQGGNITIGAVLTTDATRGGHPNYATVDTTFDALTINTRGNLIAGLGDVIIGTNTRLKMAIDLIGDIQAANVVIKPRDYGAQNGAPSEVSGSIGNITATGNIDIAIGTANVPREKDTMNDLRGWTSWTSTVAEGSNVIGNLTAQSGNITFVSGHINGRVGDISAPKGTVDLTIGSLKEIGAVTGAKVKRNIGEAPKASK